GKAQTALPGRSSPAGTGSGVGALDTTCQWSGAVTVNVNVALRSGCSKTANMRRVSATSNCEYRYTSSSTGSTNRCRPSPVFMYAQSATTTSSLLACRSGSCTREFPNTSTGSSDVPLRTTSWTTGAMRSMNVDAPGSASNSTRVLDPNTSLPRVRSSSTS